MYYKDIKVWISCVLKRDNKTTKSTAVIISLSQYTILIVFTDFIDVCWLQEAFTNLSLCRTVFVSDFLKEV